MADTSLPLFEGALASYGTSQRDFLYWLKFYHYRVYTADDKDRPPERIVEYDVLLDIWLEKQEFKRKNPPKNDASDSQYVWGE